MYCRNCGGEMHPEAVVCVKCGVPAGKGSDYCNNCGNQVHPEAVFCVRCGVKLGGNKPEVRADAKSRIVGGLLGIFLGALGVHNFYIGRTKRGTAQLLLTMLLPFSFIILFIVGIISGITGVYNSPTMEGITAGFSILVLMGILGAIASSVWGFIEAILLFCGATKTDGHGNPFRE